MKSFLDYVTNPFSVQKSLYDNTVGRLFQSQPVAQPQPVMQSQQLYTPVPRSTPAPQPQVLGTKTAVNNVPVNNPSEANNISVQPTITEEELNQIYNPSFQTLDRQLTNAGLNRDESLSALSRSVANQREKLTSYLTSGEQDIQEQQAELGKVAEDAYSQARRLFNELTQNRIARFGTGSSAGEAVSEIIGRETQRSMGTARGQYQAGINQTLKAQRDLKQWHDTESRAIDLYHQEQEDEIRRLYRQDAEKIDAQRGALAQAKSEAKIEALRQAREASFNLRLETEAYKTRLKLLSDAKELDLSNQLSNYVNSLNEDIGMSDDYGAGVSNSTDYLASLGLSPQTSSQLPAVLRGRVNREIDDDDSLFFA